MVLLVDDGMQASASQSSILSARFTFLFSIYPSDDDRTEVSEAYESTVFENPSKCRIFKKKFLAFLMNFCPFKM